MRWQSVTFVRREPKRGGGRVGEGSVIECCGGSYEGMKRLELKTVTSTKGSMDCHENNFQLHAEHGHASTYAFVAISKNADKFAARRLTPANPLGLTPINVTRRANCLQVCQENLANETRLGKD